MGSFDMVWSRRWCSQLSFARPSGEDGVTGL